jgi:hypothetical protein
MFDYRDCSNRLHVRGVRFDEKEYMFVAMVCAGESESVAYGLVYDIENFKRNIPSENEEEYLRELQPKADVLLQQQECIQLREIIEESIRAEIQTKATDIKTYKFSSQEIVNMLSALLADRSSEISEASVRDIVSLIRELANLGGLSGSDGFQSHFIQCHDPFNSLCSKCGHEFDSYAGMDCVCPRCHQVYKWSEEDKRFYPDVEHL